MNRTLNLLDTTSKLLLAIWTGTLWMTAIAAQLIFSALNPNKALAGTVAGKLFTFVSYLGLVVCIFLLMLLIITNHKRFFKSVKVYFITLMIVLLSVNQFLLHAKITSIRAIPGYSAIPDLKSQFAFAHGLSVINFLVITLIATVLLTAILRKTR